MPQPLRIDLKKNDAVVSRSPWIFSGAIGKIQGAKIDGALASIYFDSKIVATGYYNSKTDIAIRVLSYEEKEIDLNFFSGVFKSLSHLKESLLRSKTYRLVNAEGDSLPGLVIDRYENSFVLQSSTAGIDALLPLIVEALIQVFDPQCIYEKSHSSSRKYEGIVARDGLLFGEVPTSLVIDEYGAKYFVDIVNGQKTGHFLDQRSNRLLMGEASRGRRVLNCYAYNCTIGVMAKLKGATSVVNVDISDQALKLGAENYKLNEMNVLASEFVTADVRAYLETLEKGAFDSIILDPPKFVSSKSHLMNGLKAYSAINRLAIEKVAKNGLLFTYSCSGLVDSESFQKAIFFAAREAGREVKILKRLGAEVDHSVNLFHREGEYLKGLFLQIV